MTVPFIDINLVWNYRIMDFFYLNIALVANDKSCVGDISEINSYFPGLLLLCYNILFRNRWKIFQTVGLLVHNLYISSNYCVIKCYQENVEDTKAVFRRINFEKTNNGQQKTTHKTKDWVT